MPQLSYRRSETSVVCLTGDWRRPQKETCREEPGYLIPRYLVAGGGLCCRHWSQLSQTTNLALSKRLPTAFQQQQVFTGLNIIPFSLSCLYAHQLPHVHAHQLASCSQATHSGVIKGEAITHITTVNNCALIKPGFVFVAPLASCIKHLNAGKCSRLPTTYKLYDHHYAAQHDLPNRDQPLHPGSQVGCLQGAKCCLCRAQKVLSSFSDRAANRSSTEFLPIWLASDKVYMRAATYASLKVLYSIAQLRINT